MPAVPRAKLASRAGVRQKDSDVIPVPGVTESFQATVFHVPAASQILGSLAGMTGSPWRGHGNGDELVQAGSRLVLQQGTIHFLQLTMQLLQSDGIARMQKTLHGWQDRCPVGAMFVLAPLWGTMYVGELALLACVCVPS